MRSIRLVFLSGLGADARLIERQRTLPFEIEFLEWHVPKPGQTLAEYARQMAGRIHQGSPFVLAGISFGGIVALELAQITSPAGVILISSCRSSNELSRSLRCAGHIAQVIPAPVFEWMKPLSPFVHRRFGIRSNEHAQLFDGMLKDTSAELLRWAIPRIVRWRGVASLRCPVLRIHANRDRIISPDRLLADVLIPDAGHFVNVTHADEVNAAIVRWIQGVA